MQVNLKVGLQSVSSEHVALASRSFRTYHVRFPLKFRKCYDDATMWWKKTLERHNSKVAIATGQRGDNNRRDKAEVGNMSQPV
jgi:hypothetical protein